MRCDEDAAPSPHTISPAEQYKRSRSGTTRSRVARSYTQQNVTEGHVVWVQGGCRKYLEADTLGRETLSAQFFRLHISITRFSKFLLLPYHHRWNHWHNWLRRWFPESYLTHHNHKMKTFLVYNIRKCSANTPAHQWLAFPFSAYIGDLEQKHPHINITWV